MRAYLIGLKNINFKPDNGDPVVGTNVYLGFKIIENGTGYEVTKYFLRDGGNLKLPTGLTAGEVEVSFDNKAKLVSIAPAETAPQTASTTK